MKALIKGKKGVSLGEVPVPRIKPDEVLIRVRHVGLCRTDFYVAQNKLDAKANVIIGHEFAGTIAEKGSAVRGLSVGDHVVAMPVLRNGEMLGVDVDGALAEYVSIAAVQVYTVPKTVSFQRAVFFEPLVASLAVVPHVGTGRTCIVGTNRIADLTRRVVARNKNVRLIPLASSETSCVEDNIFDMTIETELNEDGLAELVRITKPHGTIVLKSRACQAVSLPVMSIVKKEIKLVGAYYGTCDDALVLLIDPTFRLSGLVGETISLSQAAAVLMRSVNNYEDRKIIITL